MLHQLLRILLNLVTIFYCVSGENESRKNENRPDVGLQVCVESFVIHKDSIIRTEDSREMGATYISEIDLDSRKECLRLCCETDKCDVFVFEEKRPGSCYLFHCGPPDDFKCKFTNHGNYTSAVLTTNIKSQSTVELEEQIRRTQQDHDLESLRKLADTVPAKYPAPVPTASVVTEPTGSPVSETTVPVKPACSRNQFECRTSGDCIAIYNACDGVPQCADGSDEAAELGCPTEKPLTLSPPIAIQPPFPASSDLLKYQQANEHRKQYLPVYARPEKDPRAWQPGPPGQPIPQQEHVQYPQQVAMPQPQVNLGSQIYQWEYQPSYDPNKGPPNPINSFRPKNNENPYELTDEQTHIFNHKGSGLVGQNIEGRPYVDQNQPYVPYYPSEHGSWQEGQPQLQAPSLSPMHNTRPVIPQQQPAVTVSPVPCKSDEKQTPLVKTAIANPRQSEVEKKVSVEKIKSAVDVKTNSQVTDATYRDTPQPDIPSQHQAADVFVEQTNKRRVSHLIMEHLHQDSDDKDLRPRGAVISLALGLTTTAIMAGLIACRLRVVRRRGRRGHGPYAHDADYLVNGMYL